MLNLNRFIGKKNINIKMESKRGNEYSSCFFIYLIISAMQIATCCKSMGVSENY